MGSTVAQRFEFSSQSEVQEAQAKEGVATASTKLLPDMTDKSVNDVFDVAVGASIGDGLPPLQITNREAEEARIRVAEVTARALSSGKLTLGGTEAEIVRAAIEHQLLAGGAKAADSLASTITRGVPGKSEGLPNGMRLVIRPDSQFEKVVKDYAAQNSQAVPTYIRLVELKDKSGKLLGSVGITGDAEAHKRSR